MSWIPLKKIIKHLENRKFNWLADGRTKYLQIRIDTRDDHAVLLDRDGNVLAKSEKELDALFETLNAKGEKNACFSKLSSDDFYKPLIEKVSDEDEG